MHKVPYVRRFRNIGRLFLNEGVWSLSKASFVYPVSSLLPTGGSSAFQTDDESAFLMTESANHQPFPPAGEVPYSEP